MDGFAMAGVIRACLDYLLKAGSAGLPVMGGIAVIGLLWKGLQTAQGYAGRSNDERNVLLQFIRSTQERVDRREDAFIEALKAIQINMTSLDQRFQERQRADESWQSKTTTKLEKIGEDVWKARG